VSTSAQLIATHLANTHKSCAITLYELAVLLVHRYQAKPQTATIANSTRGFPTRRTLNEVRKQLEKYGVLFRPEVGSAQYCLVVARPPEDDAELACAIDPVCYASHHAAMVYHGITDRFPNLTTMSTPPKPEWDSYVEKRMSRDLGQAITGYQLEGLPPLQRVRVKSKRSRSNVFYFQPTLTPSYVLLRDGRLRASSIGRTFLEMLRQPDLCGGMPHVVACFKESASRYVDLIFTEVDRFGAPIDKVRAGYLLESVVGVKDERFDTWLRFASRGGSRKIDPAGPYASEYSQRWSLSLNLLSLPR
jgi:predicted transcriptional regulator of viral defense system